MHQILKTSLTILSGLFLLAQAHAEQGEGGGSVLSKVERAVTRGASAAANGIERGGKAGVEGFETGVNAAGRVAGRVVQKLGGDPSSKASPYGNDRPN